MHAKQHREILEYPAASALCAWLGNILSRNLMTAFLPKLNADIVSVLEGLDPTLPTVLPPLATVPASLYDHQQLKKKKKSSAPGVPSGSRIFSLSGAPTSMFMPLTDSPIVPPRAASSSSKKKGPAAPSTPKKAPKRGRVDSPPSPPKKGKADSAPKVGPPGSFLISFRLFLFLFPRSQNALVLFPRKLHELLIHEPNVKLRLLLRRLNLRPKASNVLPPRPLPKAKMTKKLPKTKTAKTKKKKEKKKKKKKKKAPPSHISTMSRPLLMSTKTRKSRKKLKKTNFNPRLWKSPFPLVVRKRLSHLLAPSPSSSHPQRRRKLPLAKKLASRRHLKPALPLRAKPRSLPRNKRFPQKLWRSTSGWRLLQSF